MADRADDERLVGDVVDGAYALITFAAGGEPRWDEFRALFTEPCVLALRVFPDDPAVTVMDMDAYVRAQMREGLSEEGYTETPGERKCSIVGDVAMVFQRFTMRFARADVPAVDIFSLARCNGQWRIVSIISDMSAASA